MRPLPASRPADTRILLIAYRFPPQVGGGVHRPVRMVKYWCRHGHRVAVVTSHTEEEAERDDALASLVPSDVPVESVRDRSPALTLQRLRGRMRPGVAHRLLGYLQSALQRLSLPDRSVGWWLPAVVAGVRTARRVDASVIVATGPPWTSFLVGWGVAKWCRKPLVLDYRDAWMGHFVPGDRSLLQRLVNPWIESFLAKRASGLSAAHRSVFRGLPGRGRLDRTPRLWIPNGFDVDDFSGDVAPDPDRFTLTYTGAVSTHRNPVVFLGVLDRLVAEGKLDPARVRLRIASGHAGRVRAFVSTRPALAKIVEDHGYLPQRESVRLLRTSTINLVFVRDTERRNIHSPGKLYEVLYASRPTLVLSPPGVTTQLARHAGGCRIAQPKDEEAISRALVDWYEAWLRGDKIEGPDRSRLGFYDREHQARRFSFLIERAAAHHRRRIPEPNGSVSGALRW